MCLDFHGIINIYPNIHLSSSRAYHHSLARIHMVFKHPLKYHRQTALSAQCYSQALTVFDICELCNVKPYVHET